MSAELKELSERDLAQKRMFVLMDRRRRILKQITDLEDESEAVRREVETLLHNWPTLLLRRTGEPRGR